MNLISYLCGDDMMSQLEFKSLIEAVNQRDLEKNREMVVVL